MLLVRFIAICSGWMFLASATQAQSDPLNTPIDEEWTHTTPTLGKAGEGFLATRLGYYNNEDSGDGNPFLDEELTVIEPIFVFDYNATDRLAYTATFSYDQVTSASIDRLSDFPQQSGASGDYYIGFDFGLRYQWTELTQVKTHVGYSTEYDYSSIALGGGFLRDLPDRNAKFSLDVSAFLDDVDVIRFNGTEEGSDDRFSIATTGTWYQIINPELHGEVGLTVSYQTGFLETAFNAVVIEDPTDPPNPNLDNFARGTEITEELPNSRVRTALFGQLRQYVNDQTSVELAGRIYADTWGINSFTIEPRLYRWLVEDQFLVRFGYRYYVQTEADDYEDHFTRITGDRTQDSDLADFSANGPNIKFQWFPNEWHSIDLGADYVVRSDGIDQLIASIGWTMRF